jgi:hypothetical protein
VRRTAGGQGDHAPCPWADPLVNACCNGEVEHLLALPPAGLERPSSSSAGKDPQGLTPLMHCARMGQVATAQVLLREGPGGLGLIGAVDEDGKTALHHAALQGHAELVSLLVAAGAEVEARTKQGRTPLALAAFAGHAHVIRRLLVNHGAKLNPRDEEGKTPLQLIRGIHRCSQAGRLLVSGLSVHVAGSRRGRRPDLLFMDVRAQRGESHGLAGHIRGFLDHRKRIEAHWRAVAPNDVVARRVEPCTGRLVQQRRLADGAVVAGLDELYEAAEAGRAALAEVLARVVGGGGGGQTLKLAPLKQRARAAEKAKDDYGKRVPGPDISYLWVHARRVRQ